MIYRLDLYESEVDWLRHFLKEAQNEALKNIQYARKYGGENEFAQIQLEAAKIFLHRLELLEEKSQRLLEDVVVQMDYIGVIKKVDTPPGNHQAKHQNR